MLISFSSKRIYCFALLLRSLVFCFVWFTIFSFLCVLVWLHQEQCLHLYVCVCASSICVFTFKRNSFLLFYWIIKKSEKNKDGGILCFSLHALAARARFAVRAFQSSFAFVKLNSRNLSHVVVVAIQFQFANCCCCVIFFNTPTICSCIPIYIAKSWLSFCWLVNRSCYFITISL